LLRLLGIAGALGLLAASLQTYWANPNEIFGLQGILWLASIALLLVSCARWYSSDSKAGLLPRWTLGEIALFGGIIAFSLLTHLLWLDQYPSRVDPNEFLAFADSMRMYTNPPAISMFTTTWLDTSMPSLWFVPEAAFMHLLGTTGLGGVRFWPALVGALQVIPVYLLARLVWGRTEAAIAAFAVGFMAVSIHYSRISFPNPGVPLGWAFCFYFILRGLRTRRPNDFVWAGLSAGFVMYAHYSTRLLPYLVLAFLGYLLLFHFRVFREHIVHFALLPIGFVVGFGPLIAYFVNNPKMWAGRGMDNLLIPASIPTTWDALVNDWNVISHQFVQNFLSLSAISAQDTFYWAPFMFPVEAAILMLGAGVLVWRWRQPASFLVLLWGVSVMFVISLIEVPGNNNPNFAHWSAAYPAFFLAFALPIALCLRSLRRTGFRWWRVGYALAAVGLVALAVANINFYMNIYPGLVSQEAYAYGAQGRYLSTVSPDTMVYFVGKDGLNTEIAAFMGPQAAAGQFFNPSRKLPLPGMPGKNLDFVFTGDSIYYLTAIQQYYPRGRLEKLTAPQGNAALQTVYHVTAEQAISAFGVLATFSEDKPGGKILEQSVLATAGMIPGDAAFSYPVKATWSGLLYMGIPERIEFTLPRIENARLWVMGEPYDWGADIDVDAGWVPFTVEAHPASADSTVLMLLEGSPGNGVVPRPIDWGRLWPQTPDHGLALTISADGKTIHRIDPFIGSALSGSYPVYRAGTVPDGQARLDFLPFGLSPSGPNPAVGSGILRWSGALRTDGGAYTMDLRTDASVRLSIDDKVVATKCDKKVNNMTTPLMNLAAGWHNVQIDYDPTTGSNGLEWLWTPPNGSLEIVPTSRLRYTTEPPPDGRTVWPSPAPPIVCTR